MPFSPTRTSPQPRQARAETKKVWPWTIAPPPPLTKPPKSQTTLTIVFKKLQLPHYAMNV